MLSEHEAGATVPDTYDVCFSFAGEDRDYVERVAARLATAGVRVFYDTYEEAVLWGKDLYQHLADVYQNRGRYCVVFLSRAYSEKLWTRHELANAQARAFKESREYLLPARFDDTEVPGLRDTIAYVDLRSKTPDEFAELILRKLQGGAVVEEKPRPMLRHRARWIALAVLIAIIAAIVVREATKPPRMKPGKTIDAQEAAVLKSISLGATRTFVEHVAGPPKWEDPEHLDPTVAYSFTNLMLLVTYDETQHVAAYSVSALAPVEIPLPWESKYTLTAATFAEHARDESGEELFTPADFDESAKVWRYQEAAKRPAAGGDVEYLLLTYSALGDANDLPITPGLGTVLAKACGQLRDATLTAAERQQFNAFRSQAKPNGFGESREPYVEVADYFWLSRARPAHGL